VKESSLRPLGPDFYARDTVRVARDLLGCVLETRVRGSRTAGRIVEVEAYVGPHDPAAHGYGNRRSQRNARLFGPPGTAYVYFIYGMHWCFNAVTEPEGFPSAVLVRALEPLVGVDVMQRRRGTDDLKGLCAGPGRLCQALGINRAMDGVSLAGRRIRILGRESGRPRIITSPRVGITKAAEWPLRFCLAGSAWLSRTERLPPPRDRKNKTAPR
jgi:DNA-3-methyladenine glycosylase